MKPRILIYSIAYYPHVGGAEAAVREITDRLPDYEWTMITCDLDKNLPKSEKIGAVSVHRIRSPKFLFPFAAFWYGFKLHREHQFALAWSIMTYAGFAGLFLKIFSPKIKFLLTLQEGTPISELKRKASIVYPLFWLMFKRADMIQAISEFLAAFGRSMGHTKDIVVIGNGVDLAYFSKAPNKKDVVDLMQNLGKKPGDVYMVTTSRLVKKNAIDDCITALTFLPAHFYLLVIGIGKEEENLRELARTMGVRERVFFFGFLDKEKIPTFLAASDIFVRPSRSEGFGNSFIEAMAAGLPVITTPVGGIVDFIDDKETGMFVRPNNPKSLAAAAEELMHTTSLREKIIEQGKARVIARYDWNLIAGQMKEKVFENLLTK